MVHIPPISEEPARPSQFSPALSVLRTGTADGSGRETLVDLIRTLPADQQYTYVYQGVSQVLDHILLSRSLSRSGDRFRYPVVHVNAEYSDQVSDHDPQVVDVSLGWRRSRDALGVMSTEGRITPA